MRIENYHTIYFLGIGGIGMSALARWFHRKGYEVSGYDRTPTALTDALTSEGITITFDDAVEALPEKVVANKTDVLVIYTPAIPKDHRAFNFLQAQDFMIKKRSQILGLLTENRFTVAVAGTHGKTTTSTMITHILDYAGANCDAFLGGISVNLNSNLLVGKADSEKGVMVVEADEFDRSFLTLHPDVAVVTSADADHLDIYGDKSSLSKSFSDFISQIKLGGKLIIKEGLETLATLKNEGVEVFSYALANAPVYAGNIRIEDGLFKFDYSGKNHTIPRIEMTIPGFHNVENALAAITVALELGVAGETIKEALREFKGVKRRFEYMVRERGFIYIDDYAHHPVEIEAFLKSVKALYPDKPLTAVFQPHLFSRTRDFLTEFADSLSLADDVWLLDIYPARELPIPGISSGLLLDLISAPEKSLVSKEEVLKRISLNQPELLVTIGAGDIDKLVQPIKELRKEGYELE